MSGGAIIELHDEVTNLSVIEQVVEIIEIADFATLTDKIPASMATAEGQLPVSLAANSWSKVTAPASTGLVLQSDMGVSGKVKWATPPGQTIASQIILFGSSMTIPITNGAVMGSKIEMATNKQNLNNYPSFTNGVNLYGQWDFVMPGDWNGSTFTHEFFWTCATASGNNVIWGLQARCYAPGDAIDQVWGTPIEVTTANSNGIYYETKSAVSGAVTPAGTLAAGCSIRVQIYRKGASDNLAYPVLLKAVRLNYTRA
jgi:hypothetical protein